MFAVAMPVIFYVDRSLCCASFQAQADCSDCAAANQACFNGVTRFVRAQNALHRIYVIRCLAGQRYQNIPQKYCGLIRRATRLNVDHQQSLTGG
jgi:hypothetical protein